MLFFLTSGSASSVDSCSGDWRSASAAPHEQAAHGPDQLVDRDGTVEIEIAVGAFGGIPGAQRDADAAHQLVNGNDRVAVAVARTRPTRFVGTSAARAG